MKTLVIGASENPERYSYKAINMLRRYQHEVLAIGLKKGQVLDVAIETGFPSGEDIDTITLYLNAKNQEPYLDAILEAKPRRIIFNPGTENPVLMRLCTASGIQALPACTLVMLSTGQYD